MSAHGDDDVTGKATLAMTVSLDTYDRFAALIRAGVPADQVLQRLLDRDPHDHVHACPTCARLAKRSHEHDDDHPGLFAVG